MEKESTPPRSDAGGGVDVIPHLTPKSSKGWDGKLRVDKKAVLSYPSDPEDSDDADVLGGEQISADEDLLDDYPSDTEEIDCVHSRISSVPSLGLERFKKVARLGLRQNAIQDTDGGLSSLVETLTELDLYDNLMAHIDKELNSLSHLEILDLSFNKIKHIKHIGNLKELKQLYLLQNKITTIENLDGLTALVNLELGGNRIRKIENLERLNNLSELWLGKNKIVEISGLSALQNLKILDLKSNRIRDIGNELRLLPNLEEFYISHNALTSIVGLEQNLKLRIVDISNNAISTLVGLSHLKELEELWASYNKIGDFSEVERELADKKELTTVYFEGNPLQLRQPALYRNKVRLALPQIKQIDATFVRV